MRASASLLATLLLAGAARGADPLGTLEAEQEALFDRVAPAVVLVAGPARTGAGFFVRDGLVLTAAHVIGAGAEVELRLRDGRTLRGAVVARAAGGLDLALLRVDAPAPQVLALAHPGALRAGSLVATVGHGGGAAWTFAIGLVANARPVPGAPLLQAQLPLRPGSSGAPLVDRHGRVVGVVTAGAQDASGLAFAIRADAAREAFPAELGGVALEGAVARGRAASAPAP